MNKFIKAVIVIVLVYAIGIVGYEVGRKKFELLNKSVKGNETVSTVTAPKQEEGSMTCPIEVNAGEFNEYFRSGNEVPIIGKPVFIKNPVVVKLNKSFIEKKNEIQKMVTEPDGTVGFGGTGIDSHEKFDVDNDGKAEDIYTASIYQNHRPHIVMVVKNGTEIFEENGGNVWIEKTYENTGFTIEKEVDRTIGEYITTRYIPKDDGFMAVWTQKTCYAQFK